MAFGLGVLGAAAAGGLLLGCVIFPLTMAICTPIAGVVVTVLYAILIASIVIIVFAIAAAAFSNPR